MIEFSSIFVNIIDFMSMQIDEKSIDSGGSVKLSI